MNILINLGSILLGKALQEQLAREAEGCQVLATADVRGCDGFHPDFIIADCHTLRRICRSAIGSETSPLITVCAKRTLLLPACHTR